MSAALRSTCSPRAYGRPGWSPERLCRGRIRTLPGAPHDQAPDFAASAVGSRQDRARARGGYFVTLDYVIDQARSATAARAHSAWLSGRHESGLSVLMRGASTR